MQQQCDIPFQTFNRHFINIVHDKFTYNVVTSYKKQHLFNQNKRNNNAGSLQSP